MSNHYRRVAVTGMGCVTSLGQSVDEYYCNLLAGTTGIKTFERFDASAHTTQFGGEITEYKPKHIDHRAAKRMDRFVQFAVDASADAVCDAGLDFAREDVWRCGTYIGSGVGGIEEFAVGHEKLLKKGPDRISPFMIPKLMCNAAPGNVSIMFGLKGPNCAMATACASAAHAIGEAAPSIRHNQTDIMVAGGAEAAVTALGVACFCALKALSTRNDEPENASRPFDTDRDGFVLAEGSGILVLEEYEHAKARGAHIYCELAGYGQAADAYHITAPDEQGIGAAHAMDVALKDAELNPSDIGYINAHGTSTSLGDLAETRAIKKLFGEDAKRIPVSSTKSMTGHLLGASGGVEAITAVKAIVTNSMPPTINLDEPDEECDLDYIPKQARKGQVDYTMSNSFGFGGHNVALVFGRV